MGDRTGTNKTASRTRFSVARALGLAVVLAAQVSMGAVSGVFAADLLGPEGEAEPPPPPPPVPPLVPVRPPPPLVVAQPRCLIVPQPQTDISGMDVVRFRPTRVCFSRGMLADRLPPPPPPPVRPWWRLYW